MPKTALLDRKNMTLQEFAERFGYSLSTASVLTSKPREQYLAEVRRRHEKIKQLRDIGMSYRQIATKLNISVGTVAYALNKAREEHHETAA